MYFFIVTFDAFHSIFCMPMAVCALFYLLGQAWSMCRLSVCLSAIWPNVWYVAILCIPIKWAAFFCDLSQTFRPKKRFTQGTIRYSLHKQAQASLESGINLRQVVRLPNGENMNDWIAVHGMCSTANRQPNGDNSTNCPKTIKNVHYVRSFVSFSCGLFQSHQPDLWHRVRVLQWNHLSDNVRRTQVRVFMGGRRSIQEANAAASTAIHWVLDGLDRGSNQ